jgi:hypothetical protein
VKLAGLTIQLIGIIITIAGLFYKDVSEKAVLGGVGLCVTILGRLIQEY